MNKNIRKLGTIGLVGVMATTSMATYVQNNVKV